jgi:hypothetical protein
MKRHPGRRQLVIFAAAYLTYFGVRAFTEGRVDRAFANAATLLDVEHWLGIAWEGAIQSVVVGSQLLQDVANAIYILGHWPVIIGAGVLLFRYRREHYYSLRNVCLLTGALGLFVFAFFPVAPPRLTDLPLLDTVTRGASGYRQLLPPSLVNEYAAMPSFHAGWNLAVGIVVFRATRHWALRAFAVLMPAAMAFAVVATANHFVIDVVVGVVLVLLAFALEGRSLVPRPRAPCAPPNPAEGNYGAHRGASTVSAASTAREDAAMSALPHTGPTFSPAVVPAGIPSRRTDTSPAPH